MNITAQQYISNQKGGNVYVKIFKYFYKTSDKKADKQGDIYSLIHISSEGRLNVERLSKFVWDSIVDGYLYSTSKSTNESLKEAITQGVGTVKDLINNNKDLGAKGVNISFVIMLVKKEGIYVGVFGENDIYAFKKKNIVNISDILNEKKANTAGIALEEDDFVMVSTREVISNNISELSKLKNKKEFQDKIENLGRNLTQSSALIYFFKGNGISVKNVEKKDNLFSNVDTVKRNVQNVFKPKARIEKIKKTEGESNKLPNDNIVKIKGFFSTFYSKIKPALSNIYNFIDKIYTGIKEKIVDNLGKRRWYKKVASKVSEIKVVKRKPVGVTGMRIDDYKVKNTRARRFKILFVGIIILVLLGVGINLTIKMKHAKETSKLANETFTQIESLLEKVQNNFASDKTSAETYLYQAENLLDDVPSNLDDEDKEKLGELENKILELGDNLYKRVGVSEKLGNLATFLDNRLAFGEGSDVVDVSWYIDESENEYLVVADRGRKTIYRVSLYDKSVKALPDNEGLVTSPEQIFVGTKGVYVYDSKKGVLKAGFDTEGWFSAFTSMTGLGVSDVKTSDIAEMTVWTTSDNVYFMSKDRKSLLKSTPSYGDRYGLTYAYLNDDRFQNATDMIADLSIYVLTSEEPHILRFNYSYYENQYQEAPLTVLDFDGNYGTLTKGYTNDSLEYSLYLFDSEGKRFLRFRKPIESGTEARHPNQIALLYQYVYRDTSENMFGDVRNFVVDNKENNIYILDGSVIWKLGL